VKTLKKRQNHILQVRCAVSRSMASARHSLEYAPVRENPPQRRFADVCDFTYAVPVAGQNKSEYSVVGWPLPFLQFFAAKTAATSLITTVVERRRGLLNQAVHLKAVYDVKALCGGEGFPHTSCQFFK